MHSVGAVIAGLGLGLLATQWLTAYGPNIDYWLGYYRLRCPFDVI
jgi:hypothetical protein